jgi:hypothetical protein
VDRIALPESNRDRRLFELLEREARQLLGVREGWWRESGDRASLDEVVEAGTCVLRWFHSELAARNEEGFVSDRGSALPLMHWRDMALGVLEERTAQERTIWLHAADGSPRSICVGGREVYDPHARSDYARSARSGGF